MPKSKFILCCVRMVRVEDRAWSEGAGMQGRSSCRGEVELTSVVGVCSAVVRKLYEHGTTVCDMVIISIPFLQEY
eukprot:2807754-Rhodomonas_salina.1